MLVAINSDPDANHKLVDEISGKAYGWYQRWVSKNFGSSKYILKRSFRKVSNLKLRTN